MLKYITVLISVLALALAPANALAIKYKGDLETNESVTYPQQGSTPANPAATKHKLYIKSDGDAYTLDSSGVEEPVAKGALEATESVLLPQQGSTPTNPASTKHKLYIKSDGDAYTLNSSGVEEPVAKGALEATESVLLPQQGSTPANPAATKFKLYMKNDGNPYTLNSSGSEQQLVYAAALSGTINPTLIINGNFNIWQRGITFTSVANNTYTADHWVVRKTGAGVFDILRSTDTPDVFSDHTFQVDVTTAAGSPGAGDFYMIGGVIEGYDSRPLGMGTADAKQLTLSFYVKSPKTGTHSVAFVNGANNRTYVAEYSVTTANTWESKSITITGDTTGTWEKNNGLGLEIRFALASGTTFDTTAGSWQAGNFVASVNQVNVMDNAANNFLLSRVKLEVGSSNTGFQFRKIGEEIRLCQRYFAKTYEIGTAPGSNTNVGQIWTGKTTNASIVHTSRVSWRYPVSMRTAPITIVLYNTAGTSGEWEQVASNLITLFNGRSGVTVEGSTASGTDGRIGGHITAEAEF